MNGHFYLFFFFFNYQGLILLVPEFHFINKIFFVEMDLGEKSVILTLTSNSSHISRDYS